MRNPCLKCTLLIIGLLVFQACGDDPVDPEGQINIPATAGNIQTIAGLGPTAFDYTGDGRPAIEAKIGWITAIATDESNSVYITDGASNTVRRINVSDGKISTLSGTFIGFNAIDPTPYAGDGGPATAAHLNIPLSIAVDGSDDIFIIDAGNNVVRKITSADGLINTAVGTVTQGYTGDGGAAKGATLFNPYSIALDNDGNLYVAESGNHVVRMVSKVSGMITTIAGKGPSNPGYTGDNGLATAAALNGPQGIAVDEAGNIYIADSGNKVIRKIVDGTITTIAGTGATGYTGDGGLAIEATFAAPSGLSVDGEGNVYIADSGNHVIRKIDAATGVISTLAGSGSAAYSGDGGPATSASLSSPLGVAVDGNGNVFIADTGNSAIRVVAK